jgi:hypothetical protein
MVWETKQLKRHYGLSHDRLFSLGSRLRSPAALLSAALLRAGIAPRSWGAHLGRVMLSSRMEVTSAMKMVVAQQCATTTLLQYNENGATTP